jgi:hypothetical protein
VLHLALTQPFRSLGELGVDVDELSDLINRGRDQERGLRAQERTHLREQLATVDELRRRLGLTPPPG